MASRRAGVGERRSRAAACGGLIYPTSSMENKMKKFLIIGIASAALLGFANVDVSIAQTGDTPPPAQLEQKTAPVDNQIANEVDARIAELKANLHLTADQEKNWPGLQTALHDYGIGQLKNAMEGANRPSRSEREEHGQNDRPNDIALMRTMADDLTARGTSMKKLADAADPLYGSLDDRQRRELFQFLRTDFEKRRR
jgi:LTXXQ motif family protein